MKVRCPHRGDGLCEFCQDKREQMILSALEGEIDHEAERRIQSLYVEQKDQA